MSLTPFSPGARNLALSSPCTSWWPWQGGPPKNANIDIWYGRGRQALRNSLMESHLTKCCHLILQPSEAILPWQFTRLWRMLILELLVSTLKRQAFFATRVSRPRATISISNDCRQFQHLHPPHRANPIRYMTHWSHWFTDFCLVN